MLLLLSLVWYSARADDAASRAKDSYLDAFMESHASLNAAGGTGGGGAGAPQPQPQYGAPTPPQPQYGPPTPPQPQYGAPTPPQPQYGPPTAPQAQYGPPTPYGPATLTTTMSAVPFWEGLGAGLWSLLSQLPLPDFHTALKILLKVILVKGAVKLVSLLLMMLFVPKLEDIFNILGSIMEMGMDLEMDKDDEKPAMKPDHHKPGHHKPDHHDQDDDEDAEGADASMDDMGDAQSDAARSGAGRSRMLNALAARVEAASARVANTLSQRPCSAGWPRCGRDEPHSDSPPKKAKKKTVNKSSA